MRTVDVDAVDEWRAVCEEWWKGAHQINIMFSRGVASPADPLDHMQFSDNEIRVAVDEADRHGIYLVVDLLSDEHRACDAALASGDDDARARADASSGGAQ